MFFFYSMFGVWFWSGSGPVQQQLEAPAGSAFLRSKNTQGPGYHGNAAGPQTRTILVLEQAGPVGRPALRCVQGRSDRPAQPLAEETCLTSDLWPTNQEETDPEQEPDDLACCPLWPLRDLCMSFSLWPCSALCFLSCCFLGRSDNLADVDAGKYSLW